MSFEELTGTYAGGKPEDKEIKADLRTVVESIRE
jgi:hypothetical protein